MQNLIKSLDNEHAAILQRYIEIVKECVAQQNILDVNTYFHGLYIYLVVHPEMAHILDWIICTTIVHGGRHTIAILLIFESVFGKDRFNSPVFISLTAFFGNFDIFKYLWTQFRVSPNPKIFDIMIRRGQFQIVEFMMVQNMIQ
jgi:hypothetical protein